MCLSPFGKQARLRFLLLILAVSQTARMLAAEAETEPRPVRAAIDFSKGGGVSATSEGLQIEVEAAEPVESPVFFATLYQFRKDRTVTLPVSALPKGKSTVVIHWDELDLQHSLPFAATPLNLAEAGIADARDRASVVLKQWRFMEDPAGRRMPAAWERIASHDFRAGTDGWRPGIPPEGFGRFGWIQPSGLLAGGLQPGGFEIRALGEAGKPFQAHWTVSAGAARQKTWERTVANWTAVEHWSFFDYTAEAKNEMAATAPQLLKERREPLCLRGSVLAPGLLIDSAEKSIELKRQPDGDSPESAVSGTPAILYASHGGLVADTSGKPVAGEALAESWIVVTWPQTQAAPLMLTFKKRPSAICISSDSLRVEFPGSLERIGIAFPMGSRHAGEDARSPEHLARLCRSLGPILRAYPIAARQSFRENGSKSIEVRETFRHLRWENDWNEPARPVAPVSPVLVFAADQGMPIKLPGDLQTDLSWPTKYGPYRFVDGTTATVSLPVPPLDTRFYLRPAESSLADLLAREIGQPRPPKSPNYLKCDSLGAWYCWASSSLAFPLLDASQANVFLDAWRDRLDKALRPHAWYLRKEPFSGAEYPVSFGWVEPHTRTLGDVSSGAGGILYAVWAYARCSGDWKFVEERWPAIRGTAEYLVVEHDWAQMQSGAREHNASSSIDMEGIGYEGAVAYARMAETIGQRDEAAFARFLTARLAIPASVRWFATRWAGSPLQRDDASRQSWDALGVGLSEMNGYDFLDSKRGGPDHVNSELALSLSWVGQFPELYDLHLWGTGRAFWEWFEYDYMENRIGNWRSRHPGSRNNHPANVAAHLYLRSLLGCSSDQLLAELGEQTPWGLAPTGDIARENAGLYAQLLGGGFPLTLRSWGRAGLQKAVFDEKTNRATLCFSSDAPFELRVELKKPVRKATANHESIQTPSPHHPATITLPAGATSLTLDF